MPKFMEIYTYLQTKSKKYPKVDAAVVRDSFINQIDAIDNVNLTSHTLFNIVVETCVQNKKDGEENARKRDYSMTRAMLLEVFFRFSMALYTNMAAKTGTESNPVKDMSKSKNKQAQKPEENEY